MRKFFLIMVIGLFGLLPSKNTKATPTAKGTGFLKSGGTLNDHESFMYSLYGLMSNDQSIIEKYWSSLVSAETIRGEYLRRMSSIAGYQITQQQALQLMQNKSNFISKKGGSNFWSVYENTYYNLQTKVVVTWNPSKIPQPGRPIDNPDILNFLGKPLADQWCGNTVWERQAPSQQNNNIVLLPDGNTNQQPQQPIVIQQQPQQQAQQIQPIVIVVPSAAPVTAGWVQSGQQVVQQQYIPQQQSAVQEVVVRNRPNAVDVINAVANVGQTVLYGINTFRGQRYYNNNQFGTGYCYQPQQCVNAYYYGGPSLGSGSYCPSGGSVYHTTPNRVRNYNTGSLSGVIR